MTTNSAVEKVETGDCVVTPDVFFARLQASLNPQRESILDTLVRWAAENDARAALERKP